jgi:hypothetical protein
MLTALTSHLQTSSPRPLSNSISTMSGVSDKARFYLEQAIPQLQEFEQKKIFTKVRQFHSFWVPRRQASYQKVTNIIILG